MMTRHGDRSSMWKLLGLGAIAALVTGTVLAACGGSASESPWPVEPDSSALGPEGEDGPSKSPTVVPDAGTDAAPNVEP